MEEKKSFTEEDLELKYEKLYPDLPKDVIKMLIKTNPLYEKESVKPKEEKTQKPKVHKKEKEEKNEEEEKEFIHSLFPSEKTDTKNLMKYAFSAVLTLVAFICIIITVVISNQNKSIKEELKAAEAGNKEINLKYEELQLQKDYLSQENQKLQSIIGQLQLEINNNTSNQGQQNQSNQQQEPETTNSPTEPKQENTENNERIYIVKEGDSLWKISKEVYGNGNYYKKIMEYNNLRSEKVNAGEKLKIPNIEE